jgi:carbonic anhydrase
MHNLCNKNLFQNFWQEAVNVSLKNLLTYPFIEERVKDGRLQIHGMHYDLTEGKLTCWDIVPCK